VTQTFYPLVGSPALNQKQWSNMAQHWLETGVIKGVYSDLAVAQDTSGMQVKVLPGQAWIQGHFYESDAFEILAIGASDPIYVRLDRIIVRLDWDAGTVQLAVLQGVPSASPTAPALTQNSSRWEISLATIRVEQGTGVILFTKITDERNLVKNANAIQETPQQIVLQNGWSTYTGSPAPSFYKDEFSRVHISGMIQGGTMAFGTTLFTLPSGYRPSTLTYRSIVSSGGNAGILSISTSGAVVLQAGLPSNTWLILDEMSFPV
jgi:hypothetical protein